LMAARKSVSPLAWLARALRSPPKREERHHPEF
jgi:hypothetical protein